jgi:type 1 fimbriae regulatory protein FimB/type 1 fimbriae regulatory protein FimE
MGTATRPPFSWCFGTGCGSGELCALTWAQIDFTTARLSVIRVKNGQGAPHPLAGDELRALRQLQRSQEAGSRFVFINERGTPLSPDGFAKTLTRAGQRCGQHRFESGRGRQS